MISLPDPDSDTQTKGDILSAPKNSFIELKSIQLPLANAFYKRVYKKGIAHKNERVFVIKEHRIICAGKLKQFDGQLLLTGIASDPLYRQQGHASTLIKNILALQPEPIYCFPYCHLQDFYRQLGFTIAHQETVPAIIRQKFITYSKNRALVLMVCNY